MRLLLGLAVAALPMVVGAQRPREGTYRFITCDSICAPRDSLAAQSIGLLSIQSAPVAKASLPADVRDFTGLDSFVRGPANACVRFRIVKPAEAWMSGDISSLSTWQPLRPDSIVVTLFRVPEGSTVATMRLRGDSMHGTVRSTGMDAARIPAHPIVAWRTGPASNEPCIEGARARIAYNSLPRPVRRAVPESVGVSSERLKEATALLNRMVAEQKIAGAVAAVARRGEIAWFESVGVQDLVTKTPMSDKSLFRIYSMTKPVTSVAAMILFEEGKFTLDDPVAKYIPAFAEVKVANADGTTRPPARGITVRDLMLHTSGLNHRTSQIYRDEKVRAREYTMDQFIANLVRVPLMEDPGTRFRYSEATTVLGHLVSLWSGKPFEVFLEERVFRPLGMRETRFWASTPEQRARLTTAYAPAQGGGLSPIEIETIPFTERPNLIEGAVGLLSNPHDYYRFSQMLLNKGELDGTRLLRAESAELLMKNGLSEAVQQVRGGSMGWSLGNVNVLLRPNANNPASVGEFGWDGTAGTIFWVDPVKETVIILMTQSVPSNPDQIRQRFKEIVMRAVRE